MNGGNIFSFLYISPSCVRIFVIITTHQTVDAWVNLDFIVKERYMYLYFGEVSHLKFSSRAINSGVFLRDPSQDFRCKSWLNSWSRLGVVKPCMIFWHMLVLEGRASLRYFVSTLMTKLSLPLVVMFKTYRPIIELFYSKNSSWQDCAKNSCLFRVMLVTRIIYRQVARTHLKHRLINSPN